MSIGGPEGVASVDTLGRFFPRGHADAGPGHQRLSGFSGSWRTSPQLHVLVPISSEQTEEAEKEELRVQLKRHHPSSPLAGSKTCKRPKIKVSLISQGDAALLVSPQFPIQALGPSPASRPRGSLPQLGSGSGPCVTPTSVLCTALVMLQAHEDSLSRCEWMEEHPVFLVHRRGIGTRPTEQRHLWL